jgi:RNA polymerase sigma-70 factor (ECF subfamily)
MDETLAAALEQLHEVSVAWALVCCGWNRGEAEDVLQTVYVKVLDGRARFDGHSSLKTWLFAVIRKSAADRRRHAWIGSLGLERLWARRAGDVAAPAGEDAAERLRVRAAIARLSRRQREVIDLVFYHDLTIEEAAQVMRVSLGSARVHYQRGKVRLLELLR